MPELLTYEDYCRIPEDANRYEVINGILSMSPSPLIRHQKISGALFFYLYAWARETNAGLVLDTPVDVVLSKHDVIQPDLLFIAKEREFIITEEHVRGAPDLIIEILSPSTRRHDEVVKKALYESHGVPEYWIVDPTQDSITLFRLQAHTYRWHATLKAAQNHILTSPLLPSFSCDLNTLFP